MSEKRRALGRGMGALIPSTPPGENGSRPVDVFFKDNSAGRARPSVFGPIARDGDVGDVSRETEPVKDAAAHSNVQPEVSRETLPTAADGAVQDGAGGPDVPMETRPAGNNGGDGAPMSASADAFVEARTHEQNASGDGFTGNNDGVGQSADHGDGSAAPLGEEGFGGSSAAPEVASSHDAVLQVEGDANGLVTGGVAGAAAPEAVMSDRSEINSAPGAPGTTQDGPAVDGATEANGAPDLGGLAPVPGAWFAELPVLSIRPNPRQPRTVFDDDDMAELAHSIAEIGVLQPVVVRPIPADELADIGAQPGQDRPQYELIMGERRWRATQEAGLGTIPAIVKETHDDDLLRDALLENLHRSQLNALEEAAAYQQLLDDFGCTHDELATRIGRSRPQISNTLRLLKLPPLVQRRVAAGVLSAGHARALLGLADGAAMERLAQRIVAEGLSVRNVEEIVTIGSSDAPRPARRPRAGARHPQLDDIAARLSDRFDTRVSIALGQRKGKLTVEFASVDDLNRIVELLGSAPERSERD
jgi:ParB family transcriptional regulator, chromosome partitioning protein